MSMVKTAAIAVGGVTAGMAAMLLLVGWAFASVDRGKIL